MVTFLWPKTTARFVDGVGIAVSVDHGHVGIHSPHKAEMGRRWGSRLGPLAARPHGPQHLVLLLLLEDGPCPIVIEACVKTQLRPRQPSAAAARASRRRSRCCSAECPV